MKKRVTIGSIVGVIFFILIFLDSIINFVVNIKWYTEVGYLSVYFTKVTSILKLMVPTFIIIFIAILLYYKSLKSSITKYKGVHIVDFNNNKLEKVIFTIANIIISLFISLSFASNYWYKALQFMNSTDFKVKDPIFNMDISFFIFKLPLIESLYSTFIGLLIFLIIATLVTYFTLSAKDTIYSKSENQVFNLKDFKSGITRFAGKQLAAVSSLILLFVSVGFLTKAWNLVYSPRGVVFGASYTDVKVTLKFYYVIAAVSLLGAIVVFISIMMSKVKPIIISIALIVILIISEGVVAFVVQQFIVQPNGIKMEEPYIKQNIAYTRKAFNLDGIDEQPFNVKNDLTRQDIQDNKGTIDNIKINSFRPALEYYNQYQYIKYYYNFNDLDVDRYNINGEYTQVFLAPRELDVNSIDAKGNEWQNKHLVYTHGYGVVMNKVNSVTPTGDPDFVIKDIPPKNYTDIKLDNPRIYFGESTDDYVIVNTEVGELDYPTGSTNELSNYDGKAGINMTMLNRLLFAIDKKSTKFLLSKDINDSSKILINRNIVDRVNKIAPFLIYDSDPYLVINDGKLYWVIDAYTTSNRYPFSQPKNRVNYIRNSVKVVINAYNGGTDFYIVDKNDPIVETYSKIFPKLFKSIDDVPKGMVEHFKYPEDIFNLQCAVLGKYHVTDPGVFYRNDDLWDVAKSQSTVEGEESLNQASYIIMKLPNEEKEEMILLEYFNTKGKNNMVALFGARMDGENYGKMSLYRFPSETVYSPLLFKNKINQDTTISKEISLWDDKGSQVIYGDTLIIPIKNSLLYVEPIYLRATGENGAPQMKGVIVLYNDRLLLADSIDIALEKLFAYESPKAGKDVIDDLDKGPVSEYDRGEIQKARDVYEKAVEAQKNGDWAKYGEYIEELGKILENLNK